MNTKKVYNEFKETFLKESLNFTKVYDIDEANEEAVKDILTYFAGINTKKCPLTKSLLIRGCNGSGKSMTLKIIQKIVKNFAINNCEKIVKEYNIGGDEAIRPYTQDKERVFDDLGGEDDGKHYGLDCNVMEGIQIERYDIFQLSGLKSHYTTNLGNHQLEVRYGKRAYDRLRETCSVIILGDNRQSRRDKYNPVDKTVVKPEPIIDTRKLNEETNLRSIEKIYNGEEISNALYTDAYNFVKSKGLIKITKAERDEITKEAEAKIRAERNAEIGRETMNGNLVKASNLAKNLFGRSPSLLLYQKKIAIIRFLKEKKKLKTPLNKII